MTNDRSFATKHKMSSNKGKWHHHDNKEGNASKLQILSYHISKTLGDFFYKLGYNVARSPFKTIALSWLVTIACALGFLNFHQEREPIKLWVPEDSTFLVNAQTMMDKYGEGLRKETVLLVSRKNLLTPDVMTKLWTIHEAVRNITFKGEFRDEQRLADVCFKIPSIAKFTVLEDDDDDDDVARRRRSIDTKKKASSQLIPSFLKFDEKRYCKIINSLDWECMKESFLELWKSNGEAIGKTTSDEILTKLNTLKISPETGHQTNFVGMLGDVERDEAGRIVSAKSLITNWMVKVNFSQINYDKGGNNAGTEEFATIDVQVFEQTFLRLMEQLKRDIETEDLKVYYGAGRSYGDISSKTMFQDIDKVVYGVIFMLFYMVFVLSKYGWIEIRFSLAAVGLLNVGMAYVSGCGLASLLFPYSPVHTSLFFIIMGLGVDDIFVISSCMRKISAEHRNLSLPEKIGKTLSKAGTSITITSLTDIIAFLVGGTTVLPSLKSFCVFAAFCISINYLLVVTFFVACLVIDEKRIMQNRNGCFPLIVHKINKVWCEPKLMEKSIKFIYSKFVLTKWGKITIVFAALAISGFSTHRVFKIKQKFDPMWFIPSSSYFAELMREHTEYYPNRGFEAGVYMVDMNFTQNLPKLYELSSRLKNSTDVIDRVKSWLLPFAEFVEDDFDITKPNAMTDEQFNLQLSKFLFSTQGGEYQAYFKFKEPLECGRPANQIVISSIGFNFHKFNDRDEYLPAKRRLEKMIKDAKFELSDEAEVFLFGRIFGNWITDEIIDEEIFRNISLALVGVFFCTIVMIVNLQVCIMIFLCVLMSLVSVGGFMELWGLTLDLVTCISLQLSVGLCIDCAAHIGHTFLTISEGDGTARALKTVEHIGDAVWQGGFSTMLAVSLLAFSDAYTYQTFFRVFTIVVIFALFYGTFFLPVALSYLNPKPYQSDKIAPKERELSIIRMPEEFDSFLKKNDTTGNLDCDKDRNEQIPLDSDLKV